MPHDSGDETSGQVGECSLALDGRICLLALCDPCQLRMISGASPSFLKRGFMYLRPSWVPRSACFCLPGTKITGLHHQAQLKGYLLVFFNLKPSWKGVLGLSSYSTTKNCGSQCDKWQCELRDKMTMTRSARAWTKDWEDRRQASDRSAASIPGKPCSHWETTKGKENKSKEWKLN